MAGLDTGSAVRRGNSGDAPDAAVIRVMVVDDSVTVRSLVAGWLAAEAGIAVVGVHRGGVEAVAAAAAARPDVVVLDIDMPDMDGITALPRLLALSPGVQVIMASALTRRNAELSLKCLALGAADCLPKPEALRDGMAALAFRRELAVKVRALGAVRRREAQAPVQPARAARPDACAPALRPFSAHRPRALAIGASTGGPQALARMCRDIGPAAGGIPVFLTQHMPPGFTAILAEHLGRASGLAAGEGIHGEPVCAGRLYVAPGGRHMRVGGSGARPVIEVRDGPPVNFCKPAVDPLFQSLARVYRGGVLGIVLTGMGHDGAAGAVAVADAGGSVIAQDEATSVVWGMPGSAVAAGACAAVLPLAAIGRTVASLIAGGAR